MSALPKEIGSPALPVSRTVLLSPDSSRASEEQTQGTVPVGLPALQVSSAEEGSEGDMSAVTRSDDDDDLDDDNSDGDSIADSSHDSVDLSDVPLTEDTEKDRPTLPFHIPEFNKTEQEPKKSGSCLNSSAMPTTSVCVDLLSHAFRLRQETVQTALEKGCSLERLVSAGFTTSLDVADTWLRFYELREVAPEEISDGTRHIAVGIESSRFTLAAIEDMLGESKQTQTTLEGYKKKMDDQAKRITKLEMEVEEYQKKLREAETEKAALQEEVEVARQGDGITAAPSALLSSTLSPRYLMDKGLMERMRAPAAMEKLRSTLKRQSKLVSEIERAQHRGERWAGHALDVFEDDHDIHASI